MDFFVSLRTGMCGDGEKTHVTMWVLLFHVGLCQGVASNTLEFIKDVIQPNVILNDVYAHEGNLTKVTLTFFPMHIISLNEREQRFAVSGWFHVTWTDSNLKWAPHKYRNITRAYVACDKIWKPDLTILNSADSLKTLAASPSSSLLLSADGRVEWFPGNVFSVACKMDLGSFPFDRQDCFIQVSTWVYTSDNVLLCPDANPIRTDNWHENYEWDLYHTYCHVYNQSSDDKTYPYVEYHFLVRRRSTFYVLKFLAPIVILSLLNAFVFCVPAESGEKVSLSVSTMLSLTVFLAYLTDITPSNSDTVPEIAIFVFLHLTLAAFGVIFNILLLKLHFYQLQKASKRHRKRTQKLWTSSVEELDNPAGTMGHRKNVTQTFWRSDVDESDDDEEEEMRLPRRSLHFEDGQFFRQNSMASRRDRSVRSHHARNSQRAFRDVTTDRYMTMEIDGSSRRSTNRFVGRSDNCERGGSRSSQVGGPSGHSDFLKSCKKKIDKCVSIADHLDCICFVLFLSSSLLVSALFFIRNA